MTGDAGADADAGQSRRRSERQVSQLGLITTLVSSEPAENSRQPTTISQRAPTTVAHRPVSSAAMIISTVIGRNRRAIWYAE